VALKLSPPGGQKTWLASVLLAVGVYSATRSFLDHNVLFGIIGLLHAFCGVGLWFQQRWARWATVVLILGVAGFSGYLLVTKSFALTKLILLLGGLYIAWQVWKEFAPDKLAREDDCQPMISLVLLLRQPRYLEASILAHIVSSAWGGNYASIEDEESTRFVVGESPLFMVQSPEGMFIVHNFDRQYFDNTDAVVADLTELRTRKAVEEHQAWLAVDLISPHDQKASAESLYPQIAKLIAELAGADCLAILQPETGKINVWDQSLEETLRGPNALEHFAEPADPPVVQIDGEDPRMQAAVDEARSRWPEFVDAFKKKDGENFSIKAPITVDECTEFIWVVVDGLEPEYIHGTLGNDPVNLGNLKLGDRVEVPLKDLNDWVYMRDDKPVGLFTSKVLSAVQKERAKSKP
jgi:uncharacterized protein YegJ (DUF2314 family)